MPERGSLTAHRQDLEKLAAAIFWYDDWSGFASSKDMVRAHVLQS